jgi:ABC-2 type transport system permease protein
MREPRSPGLVKNVGGLRHGLDVLRAFFGLGLLNLVQYRAEFFISLLNAGINLLTQIFALSVIFNQTSDLMGWTSNDLLVLIGIHFFLTGLIGIVMRPSMEALMEGIRLGTFDFLLTKPADSQLLASAQVMAPQAVTDVVVGLGVIGYGVSQLGVTLSLADLGLFLIMLVAGLVIVYSFLLLLSTCAFWFVKLDNILVIFQALFGNAGRWPVTIFPGWLRAFLTFAVPVAFAVTVPAQALTGQLDLGTGLLAIGVAVVFFVAARVFWLFALRHYTGASA